MSALVIGSNPPAHPKEGLNKLWIVGADAPEQPLGLGLGLNVIPGPWAETARTYSRDRKTVLQPQTK